MTYVLTIAGISDLSGNIVSSQTLSFTTAAGADLVNPTAAIVAPQSAAENVGTNASVVVHFSERVNPITVNAATFRLLSDGSTVVAGAIALAADSLSATFTPSVSLRPFSSYNVQVTGVTDLVGRGITFTSSSFQTGAGTDVTAPVVQAISPADATTGVPVNTRVVIRLSDPINMLSVQPGTVAVVPSGGSAVAGLLSITTDRRTLTFTPGTTLLTSANYTVTVSGLRDDTGNPVAVFTSGFTTRASATADTIGPTVLSQSPGNNATGVGVTTPIVITFSEPLDPISVVSGVSIQAVGQIDDIAGTFTVNGASVAFTPLTPWPGNTDIRTTINSGVGTRFRGQPERVLLRDVPDGSGLRHHATGRTQRVAAGRDHRYRSLRSGRADVLRVAQRQHGLERDSRPVRQQHLAERVGVALEGQSHRDAHSDAAGVEPHHCCRNRRGHGSVGQSPAGLPQLVHHGRRPGAHAARDLGQRPATSTASVRGDVPIVLYASEPLAAGSVAGAVFVAADGALVSGNTSLSGGGQVITFVPTTAFPAGAHIEVFVEPTATDVNGNALLRHQGSFTIAADPATAAPTLVDRNPSGSNVPRNVRIELEFSETLDPATVNSSTVLFRDASNNVVPATISLERGGRVIRITPSALLGASAFYSYQITSGIHDLQGTPTTFNSGGFSTTEAADVTPPAITGISPPAGVANVGVNATIRLEIDEAVNPLSVNAQTLAVSDSSGALLASSIAFSDQDRAITFYPHRALASGQVIQIALDGIEDVAGNSIAPQTTAFTTRIGADVTSPTVVAISPFHGQDDVPVNVVPTVELSEPLDPTSILEGVVLRDNQTGTMVPTSNTLSADGRTVSLEPQSALVPSRPYSLWVVNSLRDLSGNQTAFVAYSFTTDSATDGTAPVVVSTSPLDGSIGIPINARIMVQFDEPLAASALGQVVLRTGGQPVVATLALSDSNRRLTITPTVPMLGLATYTLTLEGVADTSGNVAGTETVSFVTAIGPDLHNPDVVSYTPSGRRDRRDGECDNHDPVQRTGESADGHQLQLPPAAERQRRADGGDHGGGRWSERDIHAGRTAAAAHEPHHPDHWHSRSGREDDRF